MFSAARKAANTALSALLQDNILNLPPACLPEEYSFAQIFDELIPNNDTSSQEVAWEQLLVLHSCLSNNRKLKRSGSDVQVIPKIASWTAKAMIPDGRIVLNDDSIEDASSTQRQMAISLARHKGTLGLSALKYLLGFFPESPNKSLTQLDPNIITAILAFTSSRDSWTTSAAQGLAQSLLSFYTSQIHSKEFIIDHVIQSFIRPLFSKSKPEAITSTGRKAMPTSAPPKKHDVAELDRGSRPWKYEAPYSVTVFAWAVNNASQEIITDHWNMFIPPLLTLLDTPTTSILVRGLETLTAFLSKFSSKLLQQTGLGEVFEDAVMPTLLYLPSITPMEESVQILPAAFDALFILVNVRYPTLTSSTSTALIPRSDSKTSSTNLNTSDQRLALLDRLLRKGILTAHLHASDHPQIATILLSSLSTTVSKMGINCVKHLKDILPILTQAMTDPFAASRPEGLVEAVKCLESVILNAWPRMGLQDGGHGMEVVRMLVVCWGIVTEGLEENVVTKERITLLKEVERGLKVAGALLMKAMEAMDPSMDVKVELKPLLTADASLEEVFGFGSKG